MRPLLLLLATSLLAPLGAVAAFAADDAGTTSPVRRAGDLLQRVVPHVERACGATFPDPPRVTVLDATEAARIFREDLRGEVARRYPGATEGQRRALLAAAARTSVASCVARYSFHAEAIVIVEESFDAQRVSAGFTAEEAEDLLVAVLAHEAVHALDDVHHDLERFYATAPDAEGLRARAMVAEGRAVLLGRRAAEAAGASTRARALLPGGAETRDLHAWLLRLTYEAGAAFVAAVERAEGAAAATRLLAEPPRSTYQVFHADARTEEATPSRAERILAEADLGSGIAPLSELQLRARYAALYDARTAAALFAGFRGGAQSLVDATNVAVLQFADEDAAQAYVERAGDEAPTARRATLVLRAFGPSAKDLLGRLDDALGRLSER